MKVLVNALRRLRGGNATYVRELVEGLGQYPGIAVVVVSNSDDSPHWSNVADNIRCTAHSVLPPPCGLLSERLIISKALRRERPDVFHSPATLLPLWRPRCTTVVTVHDLNFFTFSQGRLKDLYKRAIYRYTASHADVIIAVSRFTASELARHYPHARSRLEVVWQGHGWTVDDHASQAETLEDPEPFILAFGHWPHKNPEAAVHMLHDVVSSGIGLSLKIVGLDADMRERIEALVHSLRLDTRVEVLGHVSDQLLRTFYESACALVFMSKYEGFGLPAVEAMALGCPVIVSDQGALPEITAGQAFVVGVNDHETAAGYVRRLITDSAFRAGERRRVRSHAAALTWDRTVRSTVEVYRRTCHSASR